MERCAQTQKDGSHESSTSPMGTQGNGDLNHKIFPGLFSQVARRITATSSNSDRGCFPRQTGDTGETTPRAVPPQAVLSPLTT